MSVDNICQLFESLSNDDQYKVLKTIYMNSSFTEKMLLLNECCGEQKVIITVEGGVAEITEKPINVMVEIDDQDVL